MAKLVTKLDHSCYSWANPISLALEGSIALRLGALDAGAAASKAQKQDAAVAALVPGATALIACADTATG